MEADTILSIGYLKEAARLSKEINYSYGEAMSYYLLGRVHGCRILNFDRGISYHKKSIALVEQLDSLDLLGENFFARGMLYYGSGLYSNALNDFLISSDYYRKNGDSLNLSILRVNIASIYAEWTYDSYPEAVKYYHQAINKAKQSKNDYLFVYAVLFYSNSLIERADFKRAKMYLDQALPIAKGDERLVELLCKIYISMADVLIQEKKIEEAVTYIEKSEAIGKKNNIKYAQADALFCLGRLYEAKGKPTGAEEYYQNALRLYVNMKMKKRIIAVYNKLANIANTRNDYKQAFELKSMQLVYEDSVAKIQRKALLSEMQASMSLIERSRLIEIERKNEQIEDLYVSKFTIATSALFLIVLLYFNRKRLRASKDKAVLAKEKLILQKELENIKLGEEKLKQALEFNAKTLTANTLNLIQKNEILEKIKAKADEIKKALPAELPLKINSLINTANFALNIDKDWENFKIHFEQVHNNFFENLKTRYPDLNSNDLRLCALLKLNLDTKEIATIMDISPESVKVARSRLRKKLQLDPSNNLSSFITQV